MDNIVFFLPAGFGKSSVKQYAAQWLTTVHNGWSWCGDVWLTSPVAPIRSLEPIKLAETNLIGLLETLSTGFLSDGYMRFTHRIQKTYESYLLRFQFCIVFKNIQMQFQRIKVKAAARLHAPVCICHWLKSNPICYIYVTVPAFTIVVKVHLTLSAVIRTNRARGGLTAVSANRHHGHFVKCKCFFFFSLF